MKPVSIIGVGMTIEDLTARHLELIDQADVLVGGKRLLNLFADSKALKKNIGKDIDGVIIGQALYTGAVSLPQAIDIAAGNAYG